MISKEHNSISNRWISVCIIFNHVYNTFKLPYRYHCCFHGLAPIPRQLGIANKICNGKERCELLDNGKLKSWISSESVHYQPPFQRKLLVTRVVRVNEGCGFGILVMEVSWKLWFSLLTLIQFQHYLFVSSKSRCLPNVIEGFLYSVIWIQMSFKKQTLAYCFTDRIFFV